MNMQVLGGCIVLMKQKASFVSASFNESRYEIQGFFAYVISQKRSANQRKKNQNSVYRVKLLKIQNSTTSEHFQKWPKNKGVVLALSL